jgi:hypothetical protein
MSDKDNIKISYKFSYDRNRFTFSINNVVNIQNDSFNMINLIRIQHY